jgi:hypothetical protein
VPLPTHLGTSCRLHAWPPPRSRWRCDFARGPSERPHSRQTQNRAVAEPVSPPWCEGPENASERAFPRVRGPSFKPTNRLSPPGAKYEAAPGSTVLVPERILGVSSRNYNVHAPALGLLWGAE